MKFRIKMDLSQFYDDERHLAYILVDPSWKEVVCLQQHVQQLFDVPEVQFLTDDGIYIPPRESIDVIKMNDILKAIVPQKLAKKRKKSKSNGFEESLEMNGQKRKSNEDAQLTCSTPNVQPMKKQKTSKSNKVKSEEQESVLSVLSVQDESSIKELQAKEEEQDESNIQALQNSNTVTSTINSNGLAKAQDEVEDTIKSRRRKRSRKPKTKEEDEKNSRLSSVPIPISSSTLRLSKSMSTPNSSAKHVHFSEDEATLVAANKSKQDRVIYRCLLSLDTEARTIGPEQPPKNDESHRQKPKIQIQEHIVLVPATVTDEHEDSSVIEVDDSVVARSEPDDDIDVQKILPLSEELSELPVVGDIILFKIYQLSEACTPEISNYICGRCENVDPSSKTVNCLVLDGLDQLCETNQTTLTPSDENQVRRCGKTNCFQFSFSEMLDKRVVRA